MDTKPKILYVDDEAINLTLFKINFSKKYHVFAGESGKEGLKILNENQDIMVVISDMKMPEMNGIEFITTAKSGFPAITYFILTGFEITEEIQKALTSGIIHEYFRKPFNMNEIDTAIENALKRE